MAERTHQTAPFVPVRFAVLTVSDTRALAEDRSGAHACRADRDGRTRARGARDRPDDVRKIRASVRAWIADPAIDVVITTGGTGFTGRDVTPEAVEPLFEKRMEGFSVVFHEISYGKIGTSTIQSRATAGVAKATFVFCLPGSPGACRDAWDGILVKQFDYPPGALQFRRDHAAARRASETEEAPAEARLSLGAMVRIR